MEPLLLLLWLLACAPLAVDARPRRGRNQLQKLRTAAATNSAASASAASHGATATQLLQSGRLAEAAAAFDRAVVLSPNGGSADFHYNRAVALQRIVPPRLEEAVWSWQMCIDREPPTTPDATTAHTVFALGRGLHSLHRFAEATAAMQTAQTLNSDSYALIAQAHECHDKYMMVKEAVGRRPSSASLEEFLVNHHEGGYREAMAKCDSAIEFEVERSDYNPMSRVKAQSGLRLAVQSKSLILAELARHSEARHFMDAALLLTPSHEPLVAAVGRLREQLQQTNALIISCTAHGELQLLWPTETMNYSTGSTAGSKLAQITALNDFPFALVSHVPGSTPPISPLYTPVWLCKSTGSDSDVNVMNAQLLEAVHHMKEDDPSGTIISNVGGWQSSRAFLDPPSTLPRSQSNAIRSLHLHILLQAREFVAAIGLDKVATPYITVRESWANVNHKLDWNDEHGHGIVSLAGCYYVDSGINATTTDPSLTATGVRLTNPRSKQVGKRTRVLQDGKVLPYYPPGLRSTEWTDASLGKAGTLALWPGNVLHWVPPHVGETARVSIAFNIEMSLHDPDGTATRWNSAADERFAAKVQQLQV